MNRSQAKILSLFLVCMIAAGVAQAADRWLHVRVEETGSYGENISVNVPLELVTAFLPAIQDEAWDHGHFDIGHGRIDDVDLREIFEALRDAPDTDFVTVRSKDEHVRVAKEGGFLRILVEDLDDLKGETVRVTLPMEVVEAMLGRDGSQLDLAAGFERLAEFDGGDLVTVESNDESIRVWIDDSQTGE
jgi:hypothetical protein